MRIFCLHRPLLTMPVITLELTVSEVSWSLRDVRIVFAPRLIWHSRNRLLAHVIFPDLQGSLRAPFSLTIFHFRVVSGQVEGTT